MKGLPIMPKSEKLDENFSNLYEKFINKFKRTGYIGNTKPYNLEHAKKIAYMAVKRILNTTSSPSSEPTEGFTGCQTCCQLKLF